MAKLKFSKAQQERLNQAEAELKMLENKKKDLESRIQVLRAKAKKAIALHKLEGRQGRPAVGRFNEEVRNLEREKKLTEASADIQREVIAQLPEQFQKEQEVQGEIDGHAPKMVQHVNRCANALQRAVYEYHLACSEERAMRNAASALPKHLTKAAKRFPEWPVDRVHPDLLDHYGQRLQSFASIEAKYYGLNLERDKTLESARKAEQEFDERQRQREARLSEETEKRKALEAKFVKTVSGRRLHKELQKAQGTYEDALSKHGIGDAQTNRTELALRDAKREFDKGLQEFEKVKAKKKKKKK